MRNTRPGPPWIPLPAIDGDTGFQALRTLRVYESRIAQLQQRSCGLNPGQGAVQLREDMHAALQMARTCAVEGGFRRASAGDLAGLASNFSRMRQCPVTEAVDDILTCAARKGP